MTNNTHINTTAHKAAFTVAESLPSAQLESMRKKLNTALLTIDCSSAALFYLPNKEAKP